MGRLANANVFDRFVASALKERGNKIAYFMVDALRYELGVALHKLIVDDGPADLHAAYAQLPTITPVGMASLLPGAQSELNLELADNALVPKLGSTPLVNVNHRAFLRTDGSELQIKDQSAVCLKAWGDRSGRSAYDWGCINCFERIDFFS